MFDPSLPARGATRSSQPARPGARVWPVGSLLKAIADSLEARFNPVAVQGEISGFSRAASGHCYFSLKDDLGQIRCAMFKRAAMLVDFQPQDGQLVEVRGRLGVYEARGELQLIVDSLQQAGQGSLFEQFLKLKAKLEAQGLFDAARKRPLPLMPRAIGVVTSLGAAVLHDVISALQRRVPHTPVVIYPASVQGAQAAQELRQAVMRAVQRGEVDVLLLVRGGGAMEDLWAFNDEALARAIADSPIPIVSGVGHETDFTITDFCADVRAPTPTAAAELCAQPQALWFNLLETLFVRLQNGAQRQTEAGSQRLDRCAARLSQPSHFVTRQQARLTAHGQRLAHSRQTALSSAKAHLEFIEKSFDQALQSGVSRHNQRLGQAALRLELLNPRQVLSRGYAWLADLDGRTVSSVKQVCTGQPLRATLVDGEVDLTVSAPRLI